MSQDGGLLRKLNPMKLFDSATSAVSEAARSGASNVFDKAAGLFRREDTSSTASHVSHKDVVAAFANLRCTVDPCPDPTSTETAQFNIMLVDKRNNVPVISKPITRKWKECEQTLSLLVGLFPRLEGVPPLPPRPSGKTGAVMKSEIDSRRNYIAKVLSILFVHSGAAGQKEFQKFLTFGADYGLGNLGLKAPVAATSASAAQPPPSFVNTTSAASATRKESSPSSSSASSVVPKNATAASLKAVETSSLASTTSASAQRPLTRTSSTVSAAGKSYTPQATTRSRSSTIVQNVSNQFQEEEDPMPTHFDEKELIMDLFHMVDDDGSGYLDTEELEPFFDAVPKEILTKEQIERCLEESDKEQTGVIDIRNFRALCQHMVQAAERPLLDIVRDFRSKHIATLYESLATTLTDPDPPPLDIDVDIEEARPLLTMMLNTGLRSVTLGEVQNQPLALPISLIEFDSIMDSLLYNVSFQELVKALAGGSEGNKTLRLLNRVAARASPKAIKLMKERIAAAVPDSQCAAQLGGGSSGASATCTSCEEMKKKMQELEEKLAAAERKLAETPVEKKKEQEPSSPGMSPKVSEMIRAQLDEAVTELEFTRNHCDELENQISELEAQNAMLKEANKNAIDALDPAALGFSGDELFLKSGSGNASGGGGGGEANPYSASTLYLLPSNMPSAGMGGDGWRRGVIDKAGALTYEGFNNNQNNSASAAGGSGYDEEGEVPLYQPMGWTVDLYLVDSLGVEHMACRDHSGRRSIAWTLERGKLVCPWSRSVIAQLPLGKWIRLTAQIFWEQKMVTWMIDGKDALQKQPFRDASADEIGTLDLYPRSSLVCCYANMRFFK